MSLSMIKEKYDTLIKNVPPKQLVSECFFGKYTTGECSYKEFLNSLVLFEMEMNNHNYERASDFLNEFMYNDYQREDYRCYMMWIHVIRKCLEALDEKHT